MLSTHVLKLSLAAALSFGAFNMAGAASAKDQKDQSAASFHHEASAAKQQKKKKKSRQVRRSYPAYYGQGYYGQGYAERGIVPSMDFIGPPGYPGEYAWRKSIGQCVVDMGYGRWSSCDSP